MKNSSNTSYPLSLCALSKTLQAVRPLVSDLGKRVSFLILFIFNLIPSSFADINLQAIAQIESGGCKNPCIGDGGKALGLYQLHYGVIKDYNQAHNTRYLHQDALDSTISQKIASWYLHKRIPQLLRHFKQPINLETTLTAYNMGVGNVIKGKRATKYINRYKELTK